MTRSSRTAAVTGRIAFFIVVSSGFGGCGVYRPIIRGTGGRFKGEGEVFLNLGG